MKKGLVIAFVTALVFAAGFSTRIWTEHHRPLPPPPGPLGSEFSHPRPPGFFGDPRRDRPPNRSELIARVQQLGPQLEAFQAKMDAIDAEFDRQMDQVLGAGQRAQRAEYLKRVHDGRAGEKRGPGKLTDDQIAFMVWDQPARTIMWDVVIPFRLDMLTRIYKLDDAQRDKVRELLKIRRDKVLQLIDSSPPPSVSLSRIARMVQRISETPPPPPDGK